MNKEEILEAIRNKKSQIESLEDDIKDLNLELEKIKKSEKPYIVRVYVNARKTFREKKFKTLESAEKFILTKCKFARYEGYSNLGVTLSFASEQEKVDGEFLKAYFPLDFNPESLKLYNTAKLIENFLNVKRKEINEEYSTSVQFSYEESAKFTSAMRYFKRYVKKEYLEGAIIEEDRYDNSTIKYSENPFHIKNFIEDVENGSIRINNSKVYYDQEKNIALIEIK